MSKDQTQLKNFLQAESVLTIATGDACGSWSAPVLYVADISANLFVLYFLSSANSRHIHSLPADGAAFGRSNFYRVTPSFIRYTNNGDSFAGRTEWQL